MAEGINKKTEYEYLAFISYSHRDITWAKWLQEGLEFYQLPTYVFEQHPRLPQQLRPIFRDETDLELGVLNDRIHAALSSSKYLIVICSPHATQSTYVADEISFFLKEHSYKNIIPFIVSGVPYAKDAESECLPLPLKNLKEKPLAANINEYSKDYAMVKVVSYLLGGIAVRKLWDRYRIAQEQEEKRKEEERMHLYRIQSLFVSGMVENLIAEGDSSTAQRLAVEILPTDLQKPNRPYVPEAEKALRDAYDSKSKVISAGNPEVLDATLGKGESLIAATMVDGYIKIWDRYSAQQISFIRVGSSRGVFSSTIAMSPDGETILFDNSENLYICNLSSNQTRIIPTSSPLISAIIPLKSAKQVLSVGSSLEIWDRDSGELVRRIKGEDLENGYRDAALCEDKQIIVAIALSGKTLAAYSLDECGRELWKKTLNSGGEAIAYSEGKDFVAVRDGSDLVILDINSGDERLRWKTGIAQYRSDALALSHDGCKVAVSVNYDICIFDFSKALSSKDTRDLTSTTLTGHYGEISSLEFSQNDDFILSSSRDGSIRQFYLQGIQERILLSEGGSNVVTFLHPVMAKGANKMVLLSESGAVAYYDYKSKESEPLVETNGLAKKSTFNHNGDLYCYSDDEEVIHLQDLRIGKEVTRFALYDVEPRDVRFAPFNEYSEEQKAAQIRKLHLSWLGFSPDDRYLWIITSANPFMNPRLPQQCVVYNIEEKKEVIRFAIDMSLFIPAFSNDSTKVYYTRENKLRSISIDDGTTNEICDFNERVSHILCPKNKSLVLCASGQSITAFDPQTGAVLYSTEPLGDRPISFVSISEEYCMYALSNGIRIFRTDSGKVIRDIVMDEGESLWDITFDKARECIVGAFHDLSEIDSISHISQFKSYIREWAFPSLQNLINTIRRTYAAMPLSEEEKQRYYLA